MSTHLVSYVIQCVDGTKEYGSQMVTLDRLTAVAVLNTRATIPRPTNCEVVLLSWTKLED